MHIVEINGIGLEAPQAVFKGGPQNLRATVDFTNAVRIVEYAALAGENKLTASVTNCIAQQGLTGAHAI